MTTNPYAEAVEAAARAIGSRASCEHERVWIDVPARRYENCFDCDGRAAVAAAVGPLLQDVRELADEWRYKGEHGWGPWQAGEGPDPEGWVLDHAAYELTQVLDAIEAGATSEGGQS